MAINRIAACCLLVVLFTVPAFSQRTAETSGVQTSRLLQLLTGQRTNDDNNDAYATGERSAEDRWQYLEWDEAEPDYVSTYEIVVERYITRTRTEEVARLHTTDNTPRVQIQPLLVPGNYRYKVISYDLLGLSGVESDWAPFVIYRAYQPEIHRTVTATQTQELYLEDENTGTFVIEGRNLFELQKDERDVMFTDYQLVNEHSGRIVPVAQVLSHDDDNARVQLSFNRERLSKGEWHVVAVDASGLKSAPDENSRITVRLRKWLDVNISLGYAPPFTVFESIDNFGLPLSPVGLLARVTFFPLKYYWGYLGIGVNAHYAYMMGGTARRDGNRLRGHLMETYCNIAYQLPLLKRRARFEAHAGIGFLFLYNYTFAFGNTYTSTSFNAARFSFDIGGAFQWYFTSRLYGEFNVDFVFAPKSGDIQFGMIIPSISIGWQL
ncbi:MAG: hypothetical protein IJ191_02225 [Treponema sp.]|nr:hypothetical protein [Treponema sp.]